MIVKMIFDFDNEDDRLRYEQMNKASAMLEVLWDIDQHLRGKLKHSELKDADTELQECRDKLYELMGENGISLDKLYQ